MFLPWVWVNDGHTGNQELLGYYPGTLSCSLGVSAKLCLYYAPVNEICGARYSNALQQLYLKLANVILFPVMIVIAMPIWKLYTYLSIEIN